ncbi:MAG TPA: type II secretion system F family protein [Actinomycetospora sp.]|uniref:type II secretion system F family protein n=1 Tax=Actinomycetospora sp. TaxID=1872135 RepID=UPI002F3ECA7E
MTGLAAALVLLASAALVAPGPVGARSRVRSLQGRPVPRRPARSGRRRRVRRDPWQEAGAWDELASCLRAGLSLDRAVRAVATSLPGPVADALTGVADLLALGADPADAWAPALGEPATARLARAARRSARSGAAIADVATTVAADVRAEAAEAVSARAERAGVLVAGPLGLCFLPAFLALGIAPVVIGLAGPLLERT